MTTSARPAPASFSERLVPGPWLFVGLLLIIPAVILTVAPIAVAFAVPVAIVVYLVITGTLIIAAPVITVSDGHLSAGRARIPLAMLGDAQVLGREALRTAIGPGMDARAHLVVRGYIHSAVRVEVTDPDDPTPYWIITSRRPKALRDAIRSGR